MNEQLYAAPQAYDAFEAIYRALEKGANTGEEVRNMLPSIAFKGMSATISFDQNGEVPGVNYKYDLLQVRGSAFTTLEQ
jgi:ABC-type branched-subunit amino acid transport system substrate-binding protein